jgi:hypothetical protein
MGGSGRVRDLMRWDDGMRGRCDESTEETGSIISGLECWITKFSKLDSRILLWRIVNE